MFWMSLIVAHGECWQGEFFTSLRTIREFHAVNQPIQIQVSDWLKLISFIRGRNWVRIDMKSRLRVRKLVLIIDSNCKYLNIQNYHVEKILSKCRSDIVSDSLSDIVALGDLFVEIFEGFWALAFYFYYAGFSLIFKHFLFYKRNEPINYHWIRQMTYWQQQFKDEDEPKIELLNLQAFMFKSLLYWEVLFQKWTQPSTKSRVKQ